MNYRHAFHAGNFADVVKHAVLARVLLHLGAKPAPYRVIDTHAGAGLYDLNGPEAGRSCEWQAGIGRLLPAGIAHADMADAGSHSADDGARPAGGRIDAAARVLLAPYLDAVAARNSAGRLTTYPGSPALVGAFLRSQDRLIACEHEPGAAAALQRNFAHDRRVKTVAIDGWTALKAYVPPKERRGLVVVDPPYEESSEFARLAQSFESAHRKWATGIYVLWYPIKGHTEPDALARRLVRSGIGKILRAEVEVGAPTIPARLHGCGLIMVNPPWMLEQELKIMLPQLAAILAAPGRGTCRIDWLSREA
jgi:23S rRNA (adenine2030-N6)-methyltransferase